MNHENFVLEEGECGFASVVYTNLFSR